MSEFCLECWNKINESNHRPIRYIFSWRKDLCEECGQYKRVVIAERLWSRVQKNVADIIAYRRKNQ